MKVLNPNNLPEAMVIAAQGDPLYEPNPDRMSVTDLISSPWKRHMKMQHFGEIETDVDDMVWRLFGNAFHDYMDKNSGKDASSEHKIEMPYGGTILVGKVDTHEGGILDDYKVTSVYSFLLGDKIEWERQLNVYAWMCKSTGIDIKKIRIIAILRDFMMRKAQAEDDYPSKPIKVVEIPLWTMDKARGYVDGRLEAHRVLTPCTPEEKWQKPTTYAVKKKGVKKALRVLATEKEAQEWMGKNGGNFVETRPGEDSMCLFYCDYAKWCIHNRYNQEQKEGE